jgi:hypothetical protein
MTDDPHARKLRGHRDKPLGRSPFHTAIPGVVAALMYLVAILVWIVVGDRLPGGRWFAVHLFTLGVLSNLVLVFTEHFARTVTRSPGDGAGSLPLWLNIGVVMVLVGMPAGATWAVGIGATIATAVVFVAYTRLRRMRKQALGARFGWIVRVYERAHGAFIHGAVLGFLMGVGWLPASWYAPARLSHLHINVLGWGGLTLLATLVFFGPTMARTRIQPGADDHAARALKHGATGLTVAVLLLLATGVGGAAATVLRLLAAVAFAAFATAVTITVLPVARAARGAKPSATPAPIIAVSAWFAAVVWADVLVVATGQWRRLDAVGLAALVGVLFQAITTALTYLAPMLRARSFAARDLVIARLERGATVRTVVFNSGVLAVVVTAAFGRQLGATGGWVALAGWVGIVAAVLHLARGGLGPVSRAEDRQELPLSQVARRYRGEDAEPS